MPVSPEFWALGDLAPGGPYLPLLVIRVFVSANGEAREQKKVVHVCGFYIQLF